MASTRLCGSGRLVLPVEHPTPSAQCCSAPRADSKTAAAQNAQTMLSLSSTHGCGGNCAQERCHGPGAHERHGAELNVESRPCAACWVNGA
jgi:hypothetical protein